MGQCRLEEKEHATFVCQFSNLLTLNGLSVQVCGEQHAYICIANISKWANNEGQHACRSICVVLRHQTTIVFRAKGKGTPPPPGVYPKGHRVGSAPQVFCYVKVSTFMAPICLPYSHHWPQGGPYIALTIFDPNVRLNNIARTLL